MRALWVDAGSDPDFVKAQTQRITALFFPITDGVATLRRRIDLSKAMGYAPGVYMAWNWPTFDGLSGTAMAERMYTLVAALTRKVKVQFDIELHDPDLIADCLERWRALNPGFDTSWTMEAFQGGWMTTDFVDRVKAAKVRLVPQAYTGNMLAIDPLATARDLTKAGFPDGLVSPFYDAAALPLYWDGFAFTQGRLP